MSDTRDTMFPVPCPNCAKDDKVLFISVVYIQADTMDYDPENDTGMVTVKCPDCKHELTLSFSLFSIEDRQQQQAKINAAIDEMFFSAGTHYGMCVLCDRTAQLNASNVCKGCALEEQIEGQNL